MLCARCNIIFENVRTNSPGFIGTPLPELFRYPDQENTWTGPHHHDCNSLTSAKAQRCYICTTLHRDLSPTLRKQAALFNTFYQIRLIQDSTAKQGTRNQYELEFMVEILFGLNPIAQEQAFSCTGTFKIVPHDDLNSHIKTLNITHDTFSGECKNRVRDWLQNCTNKHDRCKRDWRTKENFPARLLEIQSVDFITLQTIKDSDSCPRYVTMSHCWEDETQIKLIKETEADLTSGIEASKLLPKFRDALKIAHWMNVNYIWIDAFCILQDSETDWLEQSSIMGDIYAGSYCNIAATRRGQGCFTERYVELVTPYLISDPKSENSEKTHVIGYDDFWSNSLLDTHLNNRCWVLQERLLSPRTIHFGQEQIFWECRREMACEAYPDGIPEQFCNHKTSMWRRGDDILDPNLTRVSSETMQPQGFWQRIWEFLSRRPPQGSLNSATIQLSTTEIYGIWSKTIERYMECSLSKSKDKLVAISGIAQKVAASTNEKYLAGLWENSMLAGSLLWYVLGRRQVNDIDAVRCDSVGSAGYRAPSWSWASLDAKLIWNWPAQFDSMLIEIGKTAIDERLGSRMGAISSALMEVKGRLFEARLHVLSKRVDGTPDEDGRYGLTITSGSLRRYDADTDHDKHPIMMEPSVYLDTPLLPRASSLQTYLMPICTGWRGRTGYLTELAGLILRKCPTREDAYERVGIFCMNLNEANTLCKLNGTSAKRLEEVLLSNRNSITIV